MIERIKLYCAQDIIILNKSYSEFHKTFLNNIDLLNLSIDNFMTFHHCRSFCHRESIIPYSIYMLTGILKEFVMISVQGSRYMTTRNEKHYNKTPPSDFDAISLYPSVI